MFPDGPADSTLSCSKWELPALVEKSWQFLNLAQGGHPSCFLKQCAYESMLNRVDMVNIQKADLTTKEQVSE